MSGPTTLDLRDTSLAHFRITDKLGEGGMGVVYKAVDQKLQRVVALKILPAGFANDPERRARFLREARAAASLTHPNIAVVHEVGEADGRIFFSMEYVEGRSVRAMLAGGALPVDEALRIAIGIVRGLARAHERGIVHRDLKPDNVMVDREGQVKVLDFGVAKLATDAPTSLDSDVGRAATDVQVTRDGAVIGTPAYMSPEQATGGTVDARSDVFSVGVLLYEMVTGVLPFEGRSALELRAARERGTPRSPSTLHEAVPRALEALIARCLAPEPNDRFSGARELLASLDALPRPRAGARGRRAMRRALAASGVALLAVAAIAYGFTRCRASSATPMTAAKPATDSVEAAAVYAGALRAMRDASVAAASEGFSHATELDPQFSAAHLRLALYDIASPDDQRRSLAAAERGRTTLDARDAMLLRVAEATVAGERPDFEQRAARAQAAADAFPRDAEVLFVLGDALHKLGRTDAAEHAFERALEVDPSYALVYLHRANMVAETGGFDSGAQLATKCLAIAPASATCLRARANMLSARGDCEGFETDSRKLVAVEPEGKLAYQWLATALAARGAPVESVRDVQVKELSFTEPSARRTTGLQNDAAAALLAGDFAAARVAAAELSLAAAPAATEGPHAWAARVALDAEVESGATDDAARTASEYLSHLEAWSGDAPGIARPIALAVLHRARRVTDEEYASRRAAWIDDARARSPASRANEVWVDFYARPATTRAEAVEALAALPAYLPVPVSWDATVSEAVGRVHLLAGDAAAAVAPLRAAAASCWVTSDPVASVRAHEELGEALAATGDAAGACRELRAVLARWGTAKPRSITAERAGARLAGCAP